MWDSAGADARSGGSVSVELVCTSREETVPAFQARHPTSGGGCSITDVTVSPIRGASLSQYSSNAYRITGHGPRWRTQGEGQDARAR